MRGHHTYDVTECDGMADAHSSILQFQSLQSDGGDAYLIEIHTISFRILKNDQHCYPWP